MASFNKVILAGNLTRDPELRTFSNGSVIAKLGLAVTRRFTGKDGEQREETLFVDIDAFGKQAETIAKYFSKGRPILIEGRLKLDQWEDKTTHEKRTKMGVVLETFSFIDSNKNAANSAAADDSGAAGASSYDDSAPPPRRAAAPSAAPRQQYASQPPSAGGNDMNEEDVPF